MIAIRNPPTGSVKSIKPLPFVDYGGYTGLPILLDCMGDIGNLSRFLNFLDSTWELIAIDKLNVATSAGGVLRIKVQLSGLKKT